MKKIKNLFSIFMITFLFLMMGTSLAANTGDTSWSFNFGRTNFNLYTPSREKQD